ncbi:hypothetical protein N2152v2_008360 [Parachlorella kessleri]
MESEDEDFVFYGTAIEEEEETRAGQHRKDVKDPAAAKALPLWKQEVTDAQGRRRFHGAFTGGYSAGYYNTVGSAEGWAPSSFKSSRDQRWSGDQRQSVEQFLDEDELEELRRTNLQGPVAGAGRMGSEGCMACQDVVVTTEQYDTFGSTAAELARRSARDAAATRPSAIPGLLPDELVAPVADSVGVRLLQRMGWRQGKGVGSGAPGTEPAGEDGQGGSGGGRSRLSRWSQHAGLGAENTQLYLLAPKTDTFGIGFDPFKARGAEEFRKAKHERQAAAAGPGGRGQQQQQQDQQGGATRRRGVAFGTGILDEDDAFGIMDDYVTHDDVDSYEDTVDAGGLPMSRGPKLAKGGLGDRLQRGGYTFEIQEEEDGEEDEASRHPRGKQRHQYRLPSTAEPHLALQSREQLVKPGGLIPGFVRSSAPPPAPAFFPPPRIPQGWAPLQHPPPPTQQQQQQQPGGGAGGGPPPPEAQPPFNPALKQEIDTLAFYVAKNGPMFESVARQRAAREGDGRHGFLLAGEGAAYYRWKLHSLRALIRPSAPAIDQRPAPLSYEERGAMLGEKQLPAQQAAQQAQQEPAAGQTLARNLLAVAEADRQRIQAMLGRSFVAASSQETLHPEGASQGGLRQGAAAAPAPAPAPLLVVEDKGRGRDHVSSVLVPHAAAAPSDTAAGGIPAKAPAAATLAPGRIITAADLSRPAADDSVAGAAGAAAAGGKPRLPVRTSQEWRPAPLLCKRLNVPDPYHGRPAEMQAGGGGCVLQEGCQDGVTDVVPAPVSSMSRFKTDHLFLPETSAAAALAHAVPPSTDQLLLPPAVPAQQAGQAQQAEQAQQPADAAGLADQFLSSLAADLMGTAAPAQQAQQRGGPAVPPPLAAAGSGSGAGELRQPAVPSAAAAAGEAALAAEAAAAVTERPIDLFKAIFEDSDDEEEGQEGDAVRQSPSQDQPAQPSAQQPVALAAPVQAAAAAAAQLTTREQQQQQQGPGRAAGVRQGGDSVFGFAKLVQQAEGGTRRAAAASGAAANGSQGAGAAVGPAAAEAAGGEAGSAVDDETRRRVEEALRTLRKHDKGKKAKKEKKGRKDRCVPEARGLSASRALPAAVPVLLHEKKGKKEKKERHKRKPPSKDKGDSKKRQRGSSRDKDKASRGEGSGSGSGSDDSSGGSGSE